MADFFNAGRVKGQSLCAALYSVGAFALFAASVVAAQPAPEPGGVPRCAVIGRDVERIRGLTFRSNVVTRSQAPGDFREYVRASFRKQFDRDGARGYVAALLKLGAIDEPVDLEEMVLELVGSQAAAHYDPGGDVYYLLVEDLPAHALDIISSHELCHVLQDQVFDLYALLEKDMEAVRLNEDAAAARQCLVEGDATLVMTIWTLMREIGNPDPQTVSPMASVAIYAQAALPFDAVVALSKASLDEMQWGSLAAAMADLDRFPRFFVESLYSSYMQGALMVETVRAHGGWPAVNELFSSPPRSTEQVLHPEKLLDNTDPPRPVSLGEEIAHLPAGWRMRDQGVLGELGIRILLQREHNGVAPDHAGGFVAAAGWGGDRYALFAGPGYEGDVLIWKTVWDSSRDAGEFAVVMRRALKARFPGLRKAWRSSERAADAGVYQVWEAEPGRYIKLLTKGDSVDLLDTTDRVLARRIWP